MYVMMHAAWAERNTIGNEVPVHSLWVCACVCVSLNTIRRPLKCDKTVAIIQQFAFLWFLFVRIVLHLINIYSNTLFIRKWYQFAFTRLRVVWFGFRFMHAFVHTYLQKTEEEYTNIYMHTTEYVIFDELNSAWSLLIQFVPFFVHSTYMISTHSQIGYLDVVIPPDFIPEDTSSDVIVPEGSSVKLTCRFVAFFINFILLFPP